MSQFPLWGSATTTPRPADIASSRAEGFSIPRSKVRRTAAWSTAGNWNASRQYRA